MITRQFIAILGLCSIYKIQFVPFLLSGVVVDNFVVVAANVVVGIAVVVVVVVGFEVVVVGFGVGFVVVVVVVCSVKLNQTLNVHTPVQHKNNSYIKSM